MEGYEGRTASLQSAEGRLTRLEGMLTSGMQPLQSQGTAAMPGPAARPQLITGSKLVAHASVDAGVGAAATAAATAAVLNATTAARWPPPHDSTANNTQYYQRTVPSHVRFKVTLPPLLRLITTHTCQCVVINLLQFLAVQLNP